MEMGFPIYPPLIMNLMGFASSVISNIFSCENGRLLFIMHSFSLERWLTKWVKLAIIQDNDNHYHYRY